MQGIHGGDLLSIPNVVTTSAGMCDIDIRPVMGTHIQSDLCILQFYTEFIQWHYCCGRELTAPRLHRETNKRADNKNTTSKF